MLKLILIQSIKHFISCLGSLTDLYLIPSAPQQKVQSSASILVPPTLVSPSCKAALPKLSKMLRVTELPLQLLHSLKTVKSSLEPQQRDKQSQTQKILYSPQKDLLEEDSMIQQSKTIRKICLSKSSSTLVVMLGLKFKAKITLLHKLEPSFL